MRLIFLFFALSAAILPSGCGDNPADASGAGKRTLRFTAIPDQKSTKLKPRFDKVAAYLSQELGIDVEYLAVSSYSASVETFKSGDTQLAWFGGYTGVQARRAVPGARAIAQGETDPHFKSYFIANVATEIEPSDTFPMGLAGKTFAFASKDSTSGRLMPEYFLRQATDQSPEEFFGQLPVHSGSHDLTAEWVQSGRVEAGALSYTLYDDKVAKGEIDPEVCRIVWVTPEYPDYNWTAHPQLDEWFGPGFIDRLQTALVEMDDPELLDAVTRKKLIPARNEDFERVEKTALELGLLR